MKMPEIKKTNTASIVEWVKRPDYLGKHLLAEFWQCSKLDKPDFIEDALIESAKMAGATVLGVKMHYFGEGYGVTGVVLLAESHISIHTWPEFGYAAIDIFVCGQTDPHLAIQHMVKIFKPKTKNVIEHLRGSADM